jgi:hypothetical protein
VAVSPVPWALQRTVRLTTGACVACTSSSRADAVNEEHVLTHGFEHCVSGMGSGHGTTVGTGSAAGRGSSTHTKQQTGVTIAGRQLLMCSMFCWFLPLMWLLEAYACSKPGSSG